MPFVWKSVACLLAFGAGAKSADVDAARFEDAARAGAAGAGAAGSGAAGAAATAAAVAVLPASSETPRAAARTSTTFGSAHDGWRMMLTACNASSKAAGAASCSFASTAQASRGSLTPREP
jgi:hypothetical protein